MANTFTQIHIHAVFAVRDRKSLIHSSWKDELFKYMTGIVHHNGHKLLAINGMPDHVHLLLGLRPIQSLSDLIQILKRSSSLWINTRRLVPGKFSWQEGFGAFSYSHSQLKNVIHYIQNQELHHRKKNFSEEYKELLHAFDIPFDERYIFNNPDTDM